MSNLTAADIEQSFPFLLGPKSQEVKKEFLAHVMVKQFPAGLFVCREGDVCPQLAVVLSGSVRVYKVGESGREITLYRIEKGESCILTASCILSQTQFPALAVVEKDVRVALIPASILRAWVNKYDPWRVYFFNLMSSRLADVIATVEEIAFRRVDVRIAELLAGLAKERVPLAMTHQEIADELGTAREVVSRILKDFERAGFISLSRGTIVLEDKQALLGKAKSS